MVYSVNQSPYSLIQEFYDKVVKNHTFLKHYLVLKKSWINIAVFLSSETGTILMKWLKLQENKLWGLWPVSGVNEVRQLSSCMQVYYYILFSPKNYLWKLFLKFVVNAMFDLGGILASYLMICITFTLHVQINVIIFTCTLALLEWIEELTVFYVLHNKIC